MKCMECERPWKRGHECDDGPLDDVRRGRVRSDRDVALAATERRRVVESAAEAALTDFVYEHGSDFDAVEWPGMAALRAVLDPQEHAPGANHEYSRLVCVICGQRGQITLSIKPQRFLSGGSVDEAPQGGSERSGG